MRGRKRRKENDRERMTKCRYEERDGEHRREREIRRKGDRKGERGREREKEIEMDGGLSVLSPSPVTLVT